MKQPPPLPAMGYQMPNSMHDSLLQCLSNLLSCNTSDSVFGKSFSESASVSQNGPDPILRQHQTLYYSQPLHTVSPSASSWSNTQGVEDGQSRSSLLANAWNGQYLLILRLEWIITSSSIPFCCITKSILRTPLTGIRSLAVTNSKSCPSLSGEN